jgi:PAS domain S-box-containing protein
MISARHRTGIPTWALLVLAALLYFGCAKLGLLLALEQSNATPIWPPSGIGLALLLLVGRRAWPAIFLGAFAANYSTFLANQATGEIAAALASFCIAIGNTSEALLTWHLLYRFGDEKLEFNDQPAVYRFSAYIATAALLAASVGTGTLYLSNVIEAPLLLPVGLTWWVGDFLGMLLLTPLCMLLCDGKRLRRTLAPRGLRYLLFTTVAATLLIFAWRTDGVPLPRFTPYFTLFFVMFAAVRYGRDAALVSAFLASAIALPFTAAMQGPFITGILHQSLLALCTFVAVCTMVGYILATSYRDQDHKASFREAWVPLLLLTVCLATTIGAWTSVTAETEHHAEQRFKEISNDVHEELSERLRSYEGLLLSGAALFKASRNVEREEWKRFVDGLDLGANHPGVMGIGFAAYVTDADRDEVLARIRADDQPRFTIRPPAQGLGQVPVTFLEPRTPGNLRAAGFDMRSEPERARAINDAIRTGRLSATGPVRLVQDEGQATLGGFLMYLPIYEGQVKGKLLGFVYSPYRMNDLMYGIFGDSLREVRLQIRDRNTRGEPLTVFDSLPNNPSPSYLSELKHAAMLPVDRVGHTWELEITPTAVFDRSVDQSKSYIVLALGMLISVIFYGISRSLVDARRNALARMNQSVESLQQKTANLAESEARFKLLTSAISNHAIFLLDADGIVVSWNDGARRLFGYEQEWIVGRHAWILWRTGEGGATTPQQILKVASATGQYEDLGLRPRADGSTFLALAQVFPVRNEQGETMGFANIVRDVTAEKAAEADLNQAKTDAEAASRAKSAFVANMSHELRTPMNAVLGMAQLLAQTELTGQQRNYLQMLSASGKSLLAILNDVLDFSKVEANKLELDEAEFCLDDVIDAACSIMAVSAAEKQVRAVIELHPAVPLHLVGDAQRLQQILFNLLSNAIKFTEAGVVRLTITSDVLTDGRTSVRFEVRDTGIGMSKTQLERLFQPFTQADSSMARRFGGTGLGLAIARRFANLMHGDIEVHSVLGEGSCFVLSVPLQVVAAPPPDRYVLDRCNVIYLNADTTQDRSLGWIAERWGWNLVCLRSAAELTNTAQRPDIVIASDAMASALQRHWEGRRPLLIRLAESFRQYGKDVGGVRFDQMVAAPLVRSALFHAVSNRPESHKLAHVASEISGLRILLAEDNPINQQVATGILQRAGAKVEVVDNGQQAVDLLREYADQYDVIILDVQMPVMDGFAAAAHIRQELKLSLPIIAMSAGVTLAEQAQSTAAGMDAFVAKPVDVDILLATVARFVTTKGTFDVSKLLGMSVGKPDQLGVLQKMVSNAVDFSTQTAQEIRAAVASDEYDQAAKLLHSLRGTCGALGALRLAEATKVAEKSLREHADEEIGPALAQVWHELDRTTVGARSWLASAAAQ